MAATAPAHYIRTIHTSFTAAHPRNAHAAPAAWAARSQAPLHHHTKDRDLHPAQYHYQHHTPQPYSPSISTHNQHSYTHHLQALGQGGYPQQQPYSPQGVVRRKASGGLASTAGAPAAGPAGAGGRRRSASIRMPPSYVAPAARARPAPQAASYKFDPFADDEQPQPTGNVFQSLSSAPPAPLLAATGPLASSAQANRAAGDHPARRGEAAQAYGGAPYTIHIPAAQPTEIQRYTPPPPPAARAATLRSLIPINGPLPGTAPTTTAPSTTLSRSPSPPSPSTPRNTLSRSPSPPGGKTTAQPRPMAQAAPNLSKIVAGILLNRVHAVGKPMRRRVLPRVAEGGEKGAYRKSCLSSVVSVEV